MGAGRPPLSQYLSTLDKVQYVVLIHTPSIIFFFFILGPLIFSLRVPILSSTSMLPSVIQYHTGRFVRALERCASLHPFTFPHGSANSKLKVSQRRPIDRTIYHFVAFGQLLLFVGWHVWIFLFVCLVDAILKRHEAELYSKIFLYPAMVMVLIYVWIIVAIGGLGEIRWWPSQDRLSRLVPPSIKSATMTKCRWTLLFYRP